MRIMIVERGEDIINNILLRNWKIMEAVIIIDPGVEEIELAADIGGAEEAVAQEIIEIVDIMIRVLLSGQKIWERILARLISTKKMNLFHRCLATKGALEEACRLNATLPKDVEAEQMLG